MLPGMLAKVTGDVPQYIFFNLLALENIPYPGILVDSLNTFAQFHSLRVEINFIPCNTSSEKASYPVRIFNFHHHLKISY